jgi:hypothetical protein
VSRSRAEELSKSLEVIPNAVFFPVALSADGKMLAFIPMITSPATHTALQKLALLNLAVNSETALSLVDVDSRVGTAGAGNSIQFTPDGKAVAYVIEEQGVDNIWINRSMDRRGVRSRILLPSRSQRFTGRRTVSPSRCFAGTLPMTPYSCASPGLSSATRRMSVACPYPPIVGVLLASVHL